MNLRSTASTGHARCPAHSLRLALLCCLLLGLSTRIAHAAAPLPGYLDQSALAARLTALDRSSAYAALSSLTKTEAGHDLWLLTLASGDPAGKPAIVVTGGASASHLVSSELCLRLAELTARAMEDGGTEGEQLRRYTFYFLPQLNPDAAALQEGASAAWERNVNGRASDDDDDFVSDEDGPEDLNGDGLISMLRVADPAGNWRVHPDDPRVMIEADEKKNEQGAWMLYSEGLDNDGDERWGEDGPGGVDFNRNFTFRYPYFAPGAGPNQVSEPETRAVADFLFEHPEIALVLSFSPEDNMMTPWQTQQGPNQYGQYSSAHEGDSPYFKYLSDEYRKLREEAKLDKAAPPAPSGAGSFSEWAYYHYGRWSVALSGWWPPELKEETPAATAGTETAKPAEGGATAAPDSAPAPTPAAAEGTPTPPAEEAKKLEEAKPEAKKEDLGERGKYDLRALKWFDKQGIEAFVPWSAVQHPDFPGQTVEVGGFKPYLRANPPASELDSLAALHYDWLSKVAGLLPRLEFGSYYIVDLGEGVYRLTAQVRNAGYLPTSTAMGEAISQSYPLQAELILPEGSSILSGQQRGRVPRLAGNGSMTELSWLVRMPQPGDFSLRVWAPAVGETRLDAQHDGNDGWEIRTWPQ